MLKECTSSVRIYARRPLSFFAIVYAHLYAFAATDLFCPVLLLSQLYVETGRC